MTIFQSFVGLPSLFDYLHVYNGVSPGEALQKRPLRHLSSSNSHIQAQWLPEETFTSLQRILVQLELKVAEDSAGDQSQLHLGNVAANAGARSSREWDERGFLDLGQFEPALGSELVSIGPPNLLGMMDAVRWYGQNSSGWKMMSKKINSIAHDGSWKAE
jgi:hypothetical protein